MNTPTERPKLAKVILIDEDGSVHYAEGEDAQKWEERMRDTNARAHVHGGLRRGGSEVKWVDTTLGEINPAELLSLRKGPSAS